MRPKMESSAVRMSFCSRSERGRPTGLIDESVDEREDPGTLPLETLEGGLEEVAVPDPHVVVA